MSQCYQDETRAQANFAVASLLLVDIPPKSEDEVNTDNVFIGARVVRDPENWESRWGGKLCTLRNALSFFFTNIY